MANADSAELRNPTNAAESAAPVAGVGLCLSGGGYRAMLFHLGTLWRLYEAGRLNTLDRISSVSGGSITAAVLALAWPRLAFDPADAADFVTHVVAPVRALARHTLDVPSVLGGVLLPGSIAERVAGAYKKHLFGEASLQALPDKPRFVINATNVQTGSLWRFSKPYMGDYQVGRVMNPTLSLASAVAASSAFPPVLSPLRLGLKAGDVVPDPGAKLGTSPYTTKVVLADGGVYDNLGLETVWKSHRTILVSDAGAKIAPEPEPHGDWGRGSLRIFDLVDNQVRSLRKRQLLGSFRAAPESAEHRLGGYWSIRSDIGHFGGAGVLPCPFGATQRLAAVKTRLARIDETLQEQLINWGYAICDAALRTHVDTALPAAAGFPYKASGV